MMTKLAIPKAILVGSIVIAAAILARMDDTLAYFTAEARADVAGMSYFQLRRDRDFKKAVEYIVQNCTVSGYVEDGYLYSSDISC